MTRRTARRSKAVAAALAVAAAALLAGCGLQTAGGAVPEASLADNAPDVDLSGAEISVGSKNFSENIILGKMALIMFKAAGADVTDLTNIPGSTAAREAMLQDQINAMWEYTGTGWINYLGNEKPIPDEQEQYVAVRDDDLEQNDLVWLPPAPMNNTYGFAITRETADEYGDKLTKLSQIKDIPTAEQTFCIETEFANRPDGMPGMLKTYKINAPDSNLKTFQTGAIYDATDRGECTFGEVFTTDGRIQALDLVVLEDDQEYFPKYNVSLVLTEQLAEEYPEIEELMAPVTEKLTDKVLIGLNAEVDVDGREPTDVAYDWLMDEGFIG